MTDIPIVTADEMRRIETLAFTRGANDKAFMEQAGKGIAEHLAHVFPKERPHITLLAGKGNNGGDGYVAATHLLTLGFSVTAYSLALKEESSPLCKEMQERFESKGGKILRDLSTLECKGILLDALVGTGFRGKATGILADVILKANASNLPIYAIDIPSGVNGNTGEVESIAICAKTTLFLEMVKVGCVLGAGWDHTGTLEKISFGLSCEAKKEVSPLAYLFSKKHAQGLLPPIVRSRHKYQAGYVLNFAGSLSMPGAAVLTSHAAMRAGAGIVRLFHPERLEALLSQMPTEVIREGWNLKKMTRILIEAKRAKAFIIGPGIGRDKKTHKAFDKLLLTLNLPCVIDADALYFLSLSSPSALPARSILTPHHQEMQRLMPFEFPWECQRYANTKQTTVVLKGGPTWVFSPGALPYIITAGDPGMATAGSGDVLTGIIGALLAQGCSPFNAALLGVFLHGIAGQIAAKEKTSYGIIASDLIEKLPEAYQEIL